MEGLKVFIDGDDGFVQLSKDPTVEEVFFYWINEVEVEVFDECKLVH